MYQFFPKERILNAPRGFNFLPLKKEEDGTLRVDLSNTPFFEFERDVISCSDPRAVNYDYAVPLESFTLMKGPDSWLAIENADGSISAGILPHYVNRGEERRQISNVLSTMRMNEPGSQKGLALMGFDISDDRIVFLTRFDFSNVPEFVSRSRKFIHISPDDMFGSFLENKRLNNASREMLTSAADLIDSVEEEQQEDAAEESQTPEMPAEDVEIIEPGTRTHKHRGRRQSGPVVQINPEDPA